MNDLKKIISILNIRERKRGLLLLLMIFIMSIIDVVGVASIMPFLAIVGDPNIIDNNIILNKFYLYLVSLGVKNNDQFIFILGIIVFLLLIFSLLFKAITTFLQFKFIANLEYNISKRLSESYIHQPYPWFLNRNSAELGKSILSEVTMIVGNGLKPMMELLMKSIIVTLLISLLILVDPKLAMIIGFTLISAYFLIYKIVRGYLGKIGKSRTEANKLRFSSLSDAFGAIKEIKLYGLEKVYIERFAKPAYDFTRYRSSSDIINLLPRFALEAIGFGGMMLVILYFMNKTGTFSKSVPILALYAFAAYRLLPALQQIYASITQLRFISPALDVLYKDLKLLSPSIYEQNGKVLDFNKNLLLKNIYFKYPNNSKTSLIDISLNIPAGAIIGIVGSTGSGKSTLIDIILGLLEPQKGTIEVDDKIINKNNIRSWQNIIGYVPQNFYLSDDSITANIAFGLSNEKINQQRIEEVCKTANIHDFITDELPFKYSTIIGERGVRLSGGQRQRIGLARALYKNPKILILDEATSALDNITEQKVMDAVYKIRKNITTIIIAHRLSTLKKCDEIYILEKGKLKDKTKFEELIKNQ
jgi:ABC-type multidrug transport system fused ATPase/permease subunit